MDKYIFILKTIESIISYAPNLIILILFLSFFTIRKVPPETAYIIDKNTHYLKTVKKGIFFFNPINCQITSKISTLPTTVKYSDVFETEDEKKYLISFDVKYSADDIDDVLFHLSEERRSIDDLLKSAMYYTILDLKSKSIYPKTILEDFKRNLDSQILYIGLNIQSYHLYTLTETSSSATAFKPHKSSVSSKDPIQFL